MLAASLLYTFVHTPITRDSNRLTTTAQSHIIRLCPRYITQLTPEE